MNGLKSRVLCVNSQCGRRHRPLGTLKDAKLKDDWSRGDPRPFYCCKACDEPLFFKPHPGFWDKRGIIRLQQLAFKRLNQRRKNGKTKKTKTD